MPAARGLEGIEDVEELLSVGRLLDVGELTPAAVGDAGFGDLIVAHGVFRADVLGPDDADDLQFANLEVDANLPGSLNRHVSVRQHLGDDGGDPQVDFVGAGNLALAVDLGFPGEIDKSVGVNSPGEENVEFVLEAQEAAQRGFLRVVPGAGGLVVDLGVVLDLDEHGQDVADPTRALIEEKGTGAFLPQRIRMAADSFRRRHRQADRLILGLQDRVLDGRDLGCFADLGDPFGDAGAGAEVTSGRQDGGADAEVAPRARGFGRSHCSAAMR